jgi:hypothetical protein
MTKEEAIRKALEYVEARALSVGAVVDVRYLDVAGLDAMAKQCPPALIETYKSVRKDFRNHWVVAFGKPDLAGQVSCPSEDLVCVFETGEVALFASP